MAKLLEKCIKEKVKSRIREKRKRRDACGKKARVRGGDNRPEESLRKNYPQGDR